MNNNNEPVPGANASDVIPTATPLTPVVESSSSPNDILMNHEVISPSAEITPENLSPIAMGIETQTSEQSRWQKVKDKLEGIKDNLVNYYGPKDKDKKYYVPGIATGLGATVAVAVTNPLFIAPITAGLTAARLDVAYVGYRQRQNQRIYSGEELTERMDSLQKRHPLATKNMRQFLAGATVGHIGGLLGFGTVDLAANAASLGNAASEVKDTITSIPDTVNNVHVPSGDSIKNIPDDIGGAVKSAGDSIGDKTASAYDSSKDYLLGNEHTTKLTGTNPTNPYTTITETTGHPGVLDRVSDSLNNNLKEVVEAPSNATKDTVQYITDKTDAISDKISDVSHTVTTDISDAGHTAVHTPIDATKDLGNSVKSTVVDAYHDTTSTVSENVTSNIDSATDTSVNTSIDAVKDAYHGTIDAVRDTGSDIGSGVKDLGMDMKDASVDTIHDGLNKTIDTTKDAYHTTEAKIDSVTSDLSQKTEGALDTSTNIVTEQYHDVVGNVKDAGKSATDLVSDKYSSVKEVVEDNAIPVAIGAATGIAAATYVTTRDHQQAPILTADRNATIPFDEQPTPQQTNVIVPSQPVMVKRPNWFARTILRRK